MNTILESVLRGLAKAERIEALNKEYRYVFPTVLNLKMIDRLDDDYGLRTQAWMFTIADQVIESIQDFVLILNDKNEIGVTFRHADPEGDDRILEILQLLQRWENWHADDEAVEHDD